MGHVMRAKDGTEAVGIARDTLERALPEDPADDRSVEDDLPLLGRERVETRRDEAADRARQGLGRRSALAHHRCELLDEKRVPLCGLCHLGGLRVGPEEVERELRSVAAGERLEGQGVVGEQAAAPGRPCVEQLRSCECQEQDGQAVQARGQKLDQVEEHRVRPVDVLEDERRRLVSRAGFDEDAHRLEEAVAVGGRRLRLESEQDREVSGDRLLYTASGTGR